VRDVTLSLRPGEWVTVIGPNGAGKTTLVETAAGVRHPLAGEVRSGAQDLLALSERERAKAVAFVPQHPVVPAGMSVAAYVALGRVAYHGVMRAPSKQDRAVVRSVLDRLELTPFADRDVSSLSGGERQRAVVGRALAQSTMILILDEPTTGLDVRHQLDVLEVIAREVRECGLAVLSTLHDLTVASRFASRLVLLHEGTLQCDGEPGIVLRDEALRRAYDVDFAVLSVDGRDVIVPRGQQTT
jgi:iron complex transport system ATP-binding protein